MKKGLVRQNGMLFGVCGGLAARYGVSPFIVRLIFFLLMLPGGFPGPLILFGASHSHAQSLTK